MLLKKKILFAALALSVSSSVCAGGIGLVYDNSGRVALDVSGDMVLTPFVDGARLAAIKSGEFDPNIFPPTAAGGSLNSGLDGSGGDPRGTKGGSDGDDDDGDYDNGDYDNGDYQGGEKR